jgi:hypothetical protein
MLIWRPRGNLIAIEATAAGVVSDIKIGRLARIARKLQKDAEEAVTVAAYVGQYTPRGSVLVLAAEHASRRQRWRIRRAFAIDTRLRRSRLYDLISHLHQEALQAIREVQPSTYDDIAELWVELLLALPQAWQRYGHSFDESSAGEFGRFGLGPADATAKNLYVEAREATKAMHDLAAEAFMLPDRVANQKPRLRRTRAPAPHARPIRRAFRQSRSLRTDASVSASSTWCSSFRRSSGERSSTSSAGSTCRPPTVTEPSATSRSSFGPSWSL